VLQEKLQNVASDVAILSAEEISTLQVKVLYSKKAQESLPADTREITLWICELNKALVSTAKEFAPLLIAGKLIITVTDYVQVGSMFLKLRPAGPFTCATCHIEIQPHINGKRFWTVNGCTAGPADNPLNSTTLVSKLEVKVQERGCKTGVVSVSELSDLRPCGRKSTPPDGALQELCALVYQGVPQFVDV